MNHPEPQPPVKVRTGIFQDLVSGYKGKCVVCDHYIEGPRDLDPILIDRIREVDPQSTVMYILGLSRVESGHPEH